MANMFVRGTVGDYALFRATFDGAADMRKSAGATGTTVYRSAEDPNEITIRADFPTMDQAKAFAASEDLREAMQRAGVEGPPEIWFVNET